MTFIVIACALIPFVVLAVVRDLIERHDGAKKFREILKKKIIRAATAKVSYKDDYGCIHVKHIRALYITTWWPTEKSAWQDGQAITFLHDYASYKGYTIDDGIRLQNYNPDAYDTKDDEIETFFFPS